MSKRILVIDDEEAIRLLTQVTLETVANWKVLTAASGQEGIAIAQAEQPDAILLDIMMPGLDGRATFRQLQTNSLTLHIPTILLTAKARDQERQEFMNLGVAGVILKPFEPVELANQIQAILSQGLGQ